MPGDVIDRILRPLRRGRATSRYPEAAPDLPNAARGLPELDTARCDGTATCATACPTGAITVAGGSWSLEAGKCIFCDACARACPQAAIAHGHRIELAVLDPRDLVVRREIRGPR
jgi:hydrogenase-4 component H